MNSKKILTVRSAIVALIGSAAFIGLAPSAFAQVAGAPTDQQDQTCTEEKYKALEAKLATCEDGNDTCAKALAACTMALIDKPTPATPTQKPYKLLCETGTTGQSGIHFEQKVGGFHCTCSESSHQRLTAAIGGSGKVEICMPFPQIINNYATKADVDDLRALIAKIKQGDTNVTQQQITTIDPSLIARIEALEQVVGEIKSHIRLPDMEFLVGAGIGFGGRNGFMFDAVLHTGLYGWFNKDIGLRALGGLGFAIEPADSDQVSPWMTFNGTVGPAFALDDDRQFVLGVGPSFRQTVRTSSTGDGVKGHYFGGSYGGQVDLRIQPWEAPLALTPYGQLGYGPVAGWSEGRKFEMNAPQFAVGLTIDLVSGVHFRDE